MLIVAFDQSIISATRISGLYTFCSTLTGIILGLVIIKARRLKPFIVFGSIMYLIAFGLLIRFRSGQHTSAVSGIIGAESESPCISKRLVADGVSSPSRYWSRMLLLPNHRFDSGSNQAPE